MHRFLLVLCACAGAQVPRLRGTPIATSEIDAAVERAMAAAHVPGVAIAVFAHGAPVYEHAYGRRDPTLPLTTDSIMTAASLTKPVVAYLVMQLVDAGTLALDRPIQDYLPQPLATYPAYAELADDPRVGKLTLRTLLDHTSGFANWRSLEDDGKLAFHFEPGARFAYSGEGFQLVQLVIEAVMHAPLDRVLADRVFGPLGMTRTQLVWQPAFEADHADGFDENGTDLGPQRRTTPNAAGGLQTCLADYARFVAAIMQRKGLTPATYGEMLRAQISIDGAHEFPTLRTDTTDANKPIRLSYGLGWGLYWTPYGRAFFKEGHDDGWRHYVVGFDGGAGLLIMTNGSNGEAMYRSLLTTILDNPCTPFSWEGFP